MDYEIVNLEKKIVVGLSAVTSNNDTKMSYIIGGLWEDLYGKGISSSIKNRINDYAIGLYSDYTNDNYTVTVGNEVSHADNDDLVVKIIPAGKYAKFTVHGDMKKAVAEAWEKIWKIDLNRSYTGDFEEYLNSDFDKGHIDIYIALK